MIPSTDPITSIPTFSSTPTVSASSSESEEYFQKMKSEFESILHTLCLSADSDQQKTEGKLLTDWKVKELLSTNIKEAMKAMINSIFKNLLIRQSRIIEGGKVIKTDNHFKFPSSQYNHLIKADTISYFANSISNKKFQSFQSDQIERGLILLSDNIIKTSTLKIRGSTIQNLNGTKRHNVMLCNSTIQANECFFENVDVLSEDLQIIADKVTFNGSFNAHDCLIKANKVIFNGSFNARNCLIMGDEVVFNGSFNCKGNLTINSNDSLTIRGRPLVVKPFILFNHEVSSLIQAKEILSLQELEKHNPSLQTLQISQPLNNFEVLKQSIQSLECLYTFPKESFESFLHRMIDTKKDREDPLYINFESIRAKLSESIDSIDTETLKAHLADLIQSQEAMAKDAIPMPSLISHFLQELLAKNLKIKDCTQPTEQSVSKMVTLIEFIQENFPNIFGILNYTLFGPSCWMHRAIVYDSLFEENSIKILEKVITPNALSVSDNQYNTPFHYAAIFGNHAAIRYMLEKIKEEYISNFVDGEHTDMPSFSYVNNSNKEGYTPLHFAVLSGSTACVELLLEEGANYSTKNIHNETALDIAINNNHQEITEILNANLRKMEISNNSFKSLTEKEEKELAAIMEQ